MHITIDEFNANFKVVIGQILIPHVHDSGVTYPASIGFHVTCLSNSRSMYFEFHVTDSDVVDNSTNQELIDYVWANIKEKVSTWSSHVISEPSLINQIYTPTSEFPIESDIDVENFNSNFTVRVARLEVYPSDHPECWCVGLNIKHNLNTQSMYIDTQVPVHNFVEVHDEYDIIDNAWNLMKERITLWAKQYMNISELVNTQYVPNDI